MAFTKHMIREKVYMLDLAIGIQDEVKKKKKQIFYEIFQADVEKKAARTNSTRMRREQMFVYRNHGTG